MIFEGYQQSYGVGMPIRITFSSPVTNKAAVEKSLQIKQLQAGDRAPGTGTATRRSTSGP